MPPVNYNEQIPNYYNKMNLLKQLAIEYYQNIITLIIEKYKTNDIEITINRKKKRKKNKYILHDPHCMII